MKKLTKAEKPRGPYRAQLGGSSWARGPENRLGTLAQCKAWAEEYGETADWCAVRDITGAEVARFRRDLGSTVWRREVRR